MIEISVIFPCHFNCKLLNKGHDDRGNLQVIDEQAITHYVFSYVGQGLFREKEIVGCVFGEGYSGNCSCVVEESHYLEEVDPSMELFLVV